MSYAYARKFDPGTGEVMMDGASWATDRPMTAIVMRVIRTPLGSYLPDPNFGIDYSTLDKARPNAGAELQAAIKRGLAFLTRPGLITNLVVKTPTVIGSAITFDLTFADPKDPSSLQRVLGKLTAGQITQLQVA